MFDHDMHEEDSSDSEGELRINSAYAEKYNSWRRKEELQKLKDRYGNDEEEDDSSSSEEEDEDAEALTPQVEKAWLRAYAAVKTKDPKIYQSVNFFENDDESDSNSGEDKPSRKRAGKEKPVYLKDFERKVILEKGGKLSDESDGDHEMITPGPSYFEEQDEIKKSIKEIAWTGSDSDSEDELLQKKKKTKEEEAKEEEEYLQWLKGQKSTLEDEKVGIELDPLRNYWNDPKLDDGEKFLRDYILNKRYIDNDDKERIPTYAEIVDEEDLSEDEKTLERQETFERKFNFRFEEPDKEFIKSYPRTIQDTVRRKDNRRKLARQEVRERKKQEKEKKKEELKQLKNLKKKEILSKLDQLKKITGNPNVGFNEDDLEGDFDPAEYDRRMQAVFNDEYYDVPVDEEKPVFEDDDEYFGNEDNWANEEYGYEEGENNEEYYEENEPHCEDEDFNMDCDFDPSQQKVKKSKRERKSKFAQAVAAEKPRFQPGDKTFEEYFDEYYKLDYEDIIDDMPCRFKYRQVPSNDFGLSTEEIFKCPDRELNAWVSLKKMSQYRTDEEEQRDVRIYRKKAWNMTKKFNVLPSLQNEEAEEGQGKRKHSKKQKQKLKESAVDVDSSGNSPAKSKKRKKEKIETISKAPSDEDSEAADTTSMKRPKQKDLSKPRKEKSIKTEKLDEGSEREEVSDDSQKKSGDLKKVTRTENDPGAVGSGDAVGKRKRKRKKRKGGLDHSEGQEQGQTEEMSTEKRDQGESEKGQGKRKKKKARKPVVSDDRLKAYGINPKKFKYMDLEREPKLKQLS